MNPRRNLTVFVIIASQIVTSCAHRPSTVANEKPSDSAAAESSVERTPSSDLKNTPWTRWSEKKTQAGALLALKGVRDAMLEAGLHDPHVNYSSYRNVNCTETDKYFRSADGTCNDLEHPLVGASGVAFGRNVHEKFIDNPHEKVRNKEGELVEKLMVPNPAEVSKEFFTRDEFKPVPFLNMLAAVWIQFMNHDWLTHGRNQESDPHRVRMENGPDRVVERTKDNPVNHNQYKESFEKVSLNEVTHWWDASQIYGSNQETQNGLRTHSRGMMKLDKFASNSMKSEDCDQDDPNCKVLLPAAGMDIRNNKQNQGYEMTGFRDNWWLGLSMLHTLFVKEHNSIAKELLKKHAKYDQQKQQWRWQNGKEVVYLDERQLDEKVFQIARLVNAAVLAKIHTIEWTPAILPNEALKTAMRINWYGLLNPRTWGRSTKVGELTNKADWFQHIKSGYLLGGIVGDRTKNYDVPYSITEEFTSVYRLHSLIPENLVIKQLNNKEKIEEIPVVNTRNEKSYPLMQTHQLKDLFYSFGTQHPGQLVLNNFPRFMQQLPIPGLEQPMDLGMVDILRDRERGVPRYNQFRRGIGLKPVRNYRDFFPANKPLDARQQALIRKFEQVYGKDANGNDNVEMIDLLVGTLGEEVRPKDFGFGETLFQIFILMASRRLMADRFFTTHYRPKYYTQTGIDWVDKNGTLASVISRHMPELAPKVTGLESAFNPWNE